MKASADNRLGGSARLHVHDRLSGADAPPLTLPQAHETALRNHPQIRVADLKALAARQVTRQVQAAFYPTLSANVMSVGTANENTRLAAIGALNNPPSSTATPKG